MSSSVTVKPLDDRLKESGLVDAAQVAAAREAVGAEDTALLQHLLDNGSITSFQARQLLAGKKTFLVGNYLIVDYLGRGGNSVIFKARHTLLQERYVALKTLERNNLHNDDTALARFRREIDILSRLDHPNVVRAYDVIQTRSQLYLVLEYIEGQDLSKVVSERGPLPIHEATDYVVQAAKGLGYAHRQSIVHRDLKPSNLLLAPNGVVKLLDLGLAKVRAQSMRSNLSLQGMCQGTPEYMAPEQAENYSDADARSDLYSLGSTLFHLLTGELPVKGGSYLHKLQNLLLQPPRPVLDARPDVPKELAAVVDRLRSRDPQLRPASAEEAIALLEPFAKRPPQEDPRSWDGKRKVALILELFEGRISPEEANQRYGLPHEELERWRVRFLEAAEQELDPSGCSASVMGEKLRDMHTKIGAQAMEIETLKQRLATLSPSA